VGAIGKKTIDMKFLKKLLGYRHMLRYLHKTIYFNFRSLPFSQAVKLPIWLYRPHIVSCKGKVILGGAIRSGMIRMGFNMVSIYPRNGVTIENRGVMVFNGRCSIGNDSYISVGRHRKIVFGDRCTATASLKLASHCGITFGDKVSIGWNCMFIDTDFHRLTRVDGKKVKAYGEIKVGNNVWFGNNCTVMKNTMIPDFTTIAAGSMLVGRLDTPEKVVIGNKRTIEVLKSGIWRNFDDDGICFE